MVLHELTVTLSERSPIRTDVVIGTGVLRRLATVLPAAESLLLVTDRNVAGTPWPSQVEEQAAASGRRVVTRILEPGEEHKTWSAVASTWQAWTDAGASRDACVLAVGGGVVTDVAGFAAATFLRGVPWVAVPTTVLATCDAALGGKTGVNTEAGKNLAGAMHHPRAVLADVDTFETLPQDVFLDGWAEVVKAGAIGDGSLLEDVRSGADAIQSREADVVASLLARSAAVKIRVVAADEREASLREVLNFGHTVGHALEHATSHRLSHGRAVAIGMVLELRLAARRGLVDPGAPALVADACRLLGLPVEPPPDVPRDEFVAALTSDKKRRAGELRIVIPETIAGDEPTVRAVRVTADELSALLSSRDGD